MSVIHFFSQFVKHPTRTGAVAPSSRGLTNLITDTAGLSSASCVIEFGSGTGVFTEAILQRIQQGTTFFAFETNLGFVEATRRRCPGVTVFHESATNARARLKDLRHAHCDCIISGLPWASFSEALQDELLDTIADVLKPGGRFVTFAYLQGLLLPAGQRFRSKLKSRFGEVTKTRTVWLNVPPAFVYCARNPSAHSNRKSQ